MSPASAWNEAERRAVPFSIIGFFTAGLVCEFVGSSVRSNSLAAACGLAGAAGAFFVILALFVGSYRQEWLHGAIAAMLSLLSLFVTNFYWIRMVGSGASILKLTLPTILTSTFLYAGLQWLHMRLSNSSLSTYLLEFSSNNVARQGCEKSVIWGCAAVGGLLLLSMIARGR